MDVTLVMLRLFIQHHPQLYCKFLLQMSQLQGKLAAIYSQSSQMMEYTSPTIPISLSCSLHFVFIANLQKSKFANICWHAKLRLQT